MFGVDAGVVLEWLVFLLNLFSILILLVGIVLVVKGIFFTQPVQKNYALRNNRNAEVRKILASYILLSLEVLVVADIVESILKPTWLDILKLALTVIIRTVISYFLNQEIEEKAQAEHEVSQWAQNVSNKSYRILSTS